MKPNKLEMRKWPKEYLHQHYASRSKPTSREHNQEVSPSQLNCFQSESHSAPPPQLDKVLTP